LRFVVPVTVPFYALPSDDVSNPLLGINCLLPAFFLKIFNFYEEELLSLVYSLLLTRFNGAYYEFL